MTKNDKVEEAKKEEGSQFNVQVFSSDLSQCLLVLPLMSPEAASESSHVKFLEDNLMKAEADMFISILSSLK